MKLETQIAAWMQGTDRPDIFLSTSALQDASFRIISLSHENLNKAPEVASAKQRGLGKKGPVETKLL